MMAYIQLCSPQGTDCIHLDSERHVFCDMYAHAFLYAQFTGNLYKGSTQRTSISGLYTMIGALLA